MLTNFDSRTARQRLRRRRCVRRLLGNPAAGPTRPSARGPRCCSTGSAASRSTSRTFPRIWTPSLAFARELRAIALDRRLSHAGDRRRHRRRCAPAAAAANDAMFLMLYDEHYASGDPGPVASQRWFARGPSASRASSIPAKRSSRWAPTATTGTTREPVAESAEHDVPGRDARGARAQRVAHPLRPGGAQSVHAWTDPDSTDHVRLVPRRRHRVQRVARRRDRLGGRGTPSGGSAARIPSLWARTRPRRRRSRSPTACDSIPPATTRSSRGRVRSCRSRLGRPPGRRNSWSIRAPGT